MVLNLLFDKVSKLTLILLMLNFFKSSICLSIVIPLVVMASSTGSEANFSRIIGISFLIKGSPPVNLIFVTPFVTNTLAIS